MIRSHYPGLVQPTCLDVLVLGSRGGPRGEVSAVIATPELMAKQWIWRVLVQRSLRRTWGPLPLCVLPAVADEVSAAIANLFSGYAQDYQKPAGKAAAFPEQFAQHIATGR